MRAFRVITIEYGEQWPDGMGGFAHPDGGSCAVQVRDLFETFDQDEANLFAVESSYAPGVHKVVVEEFEV